MFETIAVIAVILIALIVVLLGYAATRPDSFGLERSTAIKAPAAKIFPHLNDLRAHQTWSPWEQKDPTMKRTYSGAQSGKGAIYEWNGNRNIGQGRIEITEATPNSKMTMKLDFIKPFEAHNIAGFTLEPKGDATNVTWFMHGPASFMTKVMGLFCNFDKMVGKEFETGLANLKTLSEK